jgi:transcriptional regulator with XRE-family HTH domain
MTKARDPIEELIRENLEKFIKESGYSQQQVADMAGIPQANFGRYVRGENVVQAGVLKPLAELFGRTVDDFYNPDPPPPNRERVPLLFFKALPGTELTEDDWKDIKELQARVSSRHSKKIPASKKR